MTAIICGSMAYDTIMVFQDRFKNHILPEQVHILNVSFLVPQMRREYGGCAGNIAYNLKLLGAHPLPMATVGKDFQPYTQWLSYCGIDQTYIRVVDDTYTAQAYITTDMDDNQITAFHPGAMSHSHLNTIPTDKGIRLGIVAPDGKDGMLQHAAQFAAAGIPFIFDPGQGMPMFDGKELLEFIDLARWVTVNDYEAELMQDRTGLTPEQIAARVDALIVTKGASGSLIYTGGAVLQIPSAQPKDVLDPTGCGDAYRAGLIFGLLEGLDWEITGRIASLMGAIKIETYGTQNHSLTMTGFRERFRENFDMEF
ncbi:carbohydrate kinase family protein [Methylotetracoccus oryzae]|uniref:carbohydrate kinase family protein n=1 Tax=Methylotetracoccus oryzae TaxID=1919059 RepID=UPI00111B8969|nr:carbohydrate kinase family protein [Methylotetracoccus oryzae]